jgi:hypothetical protein
MAKFGCSCGLAVCRCTDDRPVMTDKILDKVMELTLLGDDVADVLRPEDRAKIENQGKEPVHRNPDLGIGMTRLRKD